MASIDVISLTAAQQHLNMTESSEDAAELAVHVTAASEMVEQLCGPVIIRQFVDEEQVGGRISLDYRPVVELVEVVSSTTRWPIAVDRLRVASGNGVIRWRHGGRLQGGPFDITYRAGRVATVAEVPEALALACRVIVAHLWETQRGVTLGPQPDSGGDYTAPLPSGFAIPYRARDLMAPYRSVVVP